MTKQKIVELIKNREQEAWERYQAQKQVDAILGRTEESDLSAYYKTKWVAVRELARDTGIVEF